MKLEMFFDYICPYSLQAYESLVDLLAIYPNLTVIWRPCEAYPRPENHEGYLHSDLCIQGMFYALNNNIDIFSYNKHIFDATQKHLLDIENVDVLAEYLHNILDKEHFRQSIINASYLKVQQDANDYAYRQSGITALPTFRIDEAKLEAVREIGVTKKQIKDFIETNIS